jgi:hypothetical protein
VRVAQSVGKGLGDLGTGFVHVSRKATDLFADVARGDIGQLASDLYHDLTGGASAFNQAVVNTAFHPDRIVCPGGDCVRGTTSLIAGIVLPEILGGKALTFKAGGGTGAFLEGARGGPGLGRLAGRSIQVSEKGLAIVESHLVQFGDVPANAAMVARLQRALWGGTRIFGADASFYLHEVSEATLMGRGLSYEAAHAVRSGNMASRRSACITPT